MLLLLLLLLLLDAVRLRQLAGHVVQAAHNHPLLPPPPRPPAGTCASAQVPWAGPRTAARTWATSRYTSQWPGQGTSCSLPVTASQTTSSEQATLAAAVCCCCVLLLCAAAVCCCVLLCAAVCCCVLLLAGPHLAWPTLLVSVHKCCSISALDLNCLRMHHLLWLLAACAQLLSQAHSGSQTDAQQSCCHAAMPHY